jgi:hypothetical protein
MDEGFYPVEEKLISGAKTGPEEVFIVDVGGNKGHDLEEFKSKWPNSPGRLILQDQPHVLKEITTLNRAVEPMVHDFYTPQPIKGMFYVFLFEQRQICQIRALTCSPYFRCSGILSAFHPP